MKQSVYIYWIDRQIADTYMHTKSEHKGGRERESKRQRGRERIEREKKEGEKELQR